MKKKMMIEHLAAKKLFAVARSVGCSLMMVTGGSSRAATVAVVEIDGQIIASTCTIQGPGGASFPVPLPDLNAATDLSGVGTVATSKRKAFSIFIGNCGSSGAPHLARAFFEVGTQVNPSTHNLTNQATLSPATGVELRLLNGPGSTNETSGTQILIGENVDPINVQQTGWFPISAAGTATLNYYAVYYQSEATVRAGSFMTSVEYSMSYL